MPQRNKYQRIGLILLALFVFAGATSAQSADTPEQSARNFYKWYLREMNNQGNPTDQKQKMLKSVSKRLGKWIYSPVYQEYGADYFIDAQDFDENWDVMTSKAVIKGSTATLKVFLAPPKGKKSNFNQTLALKLIKENGAWKIDSVNNRKLTA
ncbi:MAG: DUF3828 domain-containing protein [Pyrinomonadaceae bacterium]